MISTQPRPHPPTSPPTRMPCLLPKSHFETTASDVQSLYERVTGKKMDLSIDPEVEQEEG